MTTMPIGAVPTAIATGPTSSASPTSLAANQLDKDAFLRLMVAQLRNQDPMNPTDSSEFLAQTAQFTSLEKLDAVAAQGQQALAAQLAFGASSLVGRSITFLGDDGLTEGTGTVDSVRFTAAGPVLKIADRDVPISSVISVEA